MAHIRIKEADDILGYQFKIINHGFVRLIDYMGGDSRILEVAKNYYKDKLPKDAHDAMSYIIAHKNEDLLGTVEIKFHFEMPINEAIRFVYARAASVNEYSLRYSIARDIFDNLSPERIAEAIKKAKPDTKIDPEKLKALSLEGRLFSESSFERYNTLLLMDIAKEIARTTLGSNIYTRFYWKINLVDLLRFTNTAFDNPSDEHLAYLDTTLTLANLVAPLAVTTFMNQKDMLRFSSEKFIGNTSSSLEHDISKEAENLIDIKIPILDSGSVTLLDYMGNDLSIVKAARVSTGGEASSRVGEDRALINYLMRNEHTSPFEMVELLWKLNIPLFIYRQGGRHRTFERAFCDVDPTSLSRIKFYKPRREDIALQSASNQQGRGETTSEEEANEFLRFLGRTEGDAIKYLDNLINAGVPGDIAKRHLPVGRYVTVYFKGDLHNSLRFLQLRLHSHAQKEIRELAQAMAKGVEAVAPWSYDAFKKYRLNAVTFSEKEQLVLAAVMAGTDLEKALDYPKDLSKREKDEFKTKILRLKNEQG